MFAETKQRIQQQFAQNYTQSSLKAIVIGLGIFIVLLGLIINQPIVLTGIILYIVLP